MLAKIQLMSATCPGGSTPSCSSGCSSPPAPTLLARKPGSAKAMFFVLPLLGAVAAYFGVNH
jgi:hypothetical protein